MADDARAAEIGLDSAEAVGSTRERLVVRLHPATLWMHVRHFIRGVRAAGIPAISVVIGFLLFYAVPQAHDLFLEVRGNGWGPYFWIGFFASVLFAWALPVYVSARWIIWKCTKGLMVYQEGQSIEPWVARTVPPALAAMCFVAVAAGQFAAMSNLPQVPLECLPQVVPVGSLYNLVCSSNITLVGATIAVYVLLAILAVWIGLRGILFSLESAWLRIPSKIVWWLLTVVGLAGYSLIAVPLGLWFLGQAQMPFSVAHLAILPIASLICAWLIWRLLKVRRDGKASIIGDRVMELAGVGDDIAHDVAMSRLWEPVFYIALLLCLAIIGALFYFDPVAVTEHIYRALLVPFFLGLLVPFFTLLSHISRHLHVPLVAAVIVALGVFSATETNDVRNEPDTNAIKDAAGRYWGKWGGYQIRPSIDETVKRWAIVNGCKVQEGRHKWPRDKDPNNDWSWNCPRPILISAAGGASRAGFLVGSLIGKLIDETHEQRLKVAAIVGGPGSKLGKVQSARFTPDGGAIVAASDDGTARVWDIERQEVQIETFNRRMAWGKEQTIGLSDELKTSLSRRQVRAPSLIRRQSFCEADKSAAGYDGSNGEATKMKAAAGGDVARNPLCHRDRGIAKSHQSALTEVAIDPSGQFLITASKDQTARIWLRGNFHKLRTRESIHPSRVLDRDMSDEARNIMNGFYGFGGRLVRHDLNSVLLANRPVVSAGFVTPPGSAGSVNRPAYAATMTSDGGVQFWRLKTGNFDLDLIALAAFDKNDELESEIRDRSFAAREPKGVGLVVSQEAGLVVALFENRPPFIVALDENASAQRATRLGGPKNSYAARFAAFDSDGKYLAYPSNANEISILQLGPSSSTKSPPGEAARTSLKIKFDGPEILSAAFGPQSRWLATGHADGTVRFWNVAGKLMQRDPMAASAALAPPLVFAPHIDAVKAVQFSPNGREILTVSKDGVAQVWEPRSVPSQSGGEATGGTAAWMREARQLRPFEQQLFSISSVSGGSLGAVVAYAALADSQLRDARKCKKSMSEGCQKFRVVDEIRSKAADGRAFSFRGHTTQYGVRRSDSGNLSPPCRSDHDDTEWFGSTVSTSENRSISGQRRIGKPGKSWRDCLELILAGDFLSPVFASLVSTDLIGIAGRHGDRATVLEHSWEQRYRRMTVNGMTALERPLLKVRWQVTPPSPLRLGGSSNWLPMLLLNGTSVTTGRRIIASDVDSEWVYKHVDDVYRSDGYYRDHEVIGKQRPSKPYRVFNLELYRDSYDLHRMMKDRNYAEAENPDCAGPRDIRLSTGATMSARFPVISPHGNIRNRHCRIVDRVVDGGYFENFGAVTTFELARVLRDHYGLRPLIILINNEPTTPNLDCLIPESRLRLPKDTPQSLTFSLLKSPLGAVDGTRSARGSLAAYELCTELKKDKKSFAFFTVDPDPDNPTAELSMSWWLSKTVQRYLHDQLNFGGNSVNWRAFNKIEEARSLEPPKVTQKSAQPREQGTSTRR